MEHDTKIVPIRLVGIISIEVRSVQTHQTVTHVVALVCDMEVNRMAA